MSLTVRRTPCVGICSTTYGDLVCRGCRRFAHEIRDWNAFTPEQRQRVWQRLQTLRDGAVAAAVEIVDADAVRAAAAIGPHASIETCAWRCLQRGLLTGLRPLGPVSDPAALLSAIDQDAWERSVAWYERAYRVAAR